MRYLSIWGHLSPTHHLFSALRCVPLMMRSKGHSPLLSVGVVFLLCCTSSTQNPTSDSTLSSAERAPVSDVLGATRSYKSKRVFLKSKFTQPSSSLSKSKTPIKKRAQLVSPPAPRETIKVGALTLSPQAWRAWRSVFIRPKALDTPLKVVHYGDSHTQGAFLSQSLKDTISSRGQGRSKITSPGFVHVGHPDRWAGEVNLHGYWLRQNWLYRRDVGPFGPMGIAWITQQAGAQITLSRTQPTPRGDEVTLYYKRGPQRLGFCPYLIFDEAQLESLWALKERQEHQSAVEASTENTRFKVPETEDIGATQGTSSAQATPPHFDQLDIGALRAEPKKLAGACVPISSPDEAEEIGTLNVEVPIGYKLSIEVLGGVTIDKNLIERRRRTRSRRHRNRSLRRKRSPRKRQKEARTSPSKRRKKRAYQGPSYASAPHVISPRDKRLRILGFHVRALDADIEWSTLGVRGATIWSPAERGGEGMTRWLNDLSPDAFVLWYGTNTAARERTNLARYESQFRAVIQRIKTSSPKKACLVIAPPDFGRRDRECFLSKGERRILKRKKKSQRALQRLALNRQARVCDPNSLVNHSRKGRYRYPVPEVKNSREWEAYKERCTFWTPSLVSELVTLQERVAEEEGCAFYNTFEAMGGEGGMLNWACAPQERWAQFDLVHLSRRGYQKLGENIGRTLLTALDLIPASSLLLDPSAQGSDFSLDSTL
jgi:lysophospholipase L1-like esterase